MTGVEKLLIAGAVVVGAVAAFKLSQSGALGTGPKAAAAKATSTADKIENAYVSAGQSVLRQLPGSQYTVPALTKVNPVKIIRLSAPPVVGGVKSIIHTLTPW